MARALTISSKKCLLEVSRRANTIKINGVSLEEIITTNLPEDLESYKEYNAQVEITISFSQGELFIERVGYSNEEGKDEQHQGTDN